MAEDTDTETAENTSLYGMIVDELELEYDGDAETVDEFKHRVCMHIDTESKKDDDFYDKLPDGIADWYDDAAKVIVKNRGARNKKPLPAIDGLEEPADAEAEKAPAPRRGRAKAEGGSKTKTKEKEKKEGARAAGNRYHKLAEILLANPGMTVEQLGAAQAKAGYDYADVTIERAHGVFTAITDVLRKHGKLKE